MVVSLFETGCRVGEIGSMQIKHVSFEKKFAKLTVRGKTGMRKVVVVNSIPYLQSLINHHPQGDDPNAPLWINPKGEFLSYATIRNLLRKATERAKIKKRVHPHLFRHTRATMMASKVPEAVMKQYLGWGQDSKMCGTYIHLNGEATDNAILKMNGIEVEEKVDKSILKSPVCPRCSHKNEFTAKFCRDCGLPLDEKEAMRVISEDNKREQANEMMNSLMSDPDILDLIRKKLLKQN